MFWFVLVAVVAAISLLIMAFRPSWGTLASSACAATIGLKLGALHTLGRLPTPLEAAILLSLAALSYIILERKKRAWIAAHPLSKLLKEIEAHQRELEALREQAKAMGGHVDKEE